MKGELITITEEELAKAIRLPVISSFYGNEKDTADDEIKFFGSTKIKEKPAIKVPSM